jgi:hypothetical protein
MPVWVANQNGLKSALNVSKPAKLSNKSPTILHNPPDILIDTNLGYGKFFCMPDMFWNI